MSIFNLPDLGEGLPEAEIVEWLVKEGDTLAMDQAMVLVETAKAVVSVPAPQNGVVKTLFAKAGELVKTGAPLLEFAQAETEISDLSVLEKAVLEKTALEKPVEKLVEKPVEKPTKDTGTVVGHIPENAENIEASFSESAHGSADHNNADHDTTNHNNAVRAIPAAHRLAQQSGIDLTSLTGTGPEGIIVVADVENALKQAPRTASPSSQNLSSQSSSFQNQATCNDPIIETLRGARRAMAHAMAKSHAEVVGVTIEEDADIHRWRSAEDTTLRLIRAIAYACRIEPSLNAWYNHDALQRTCFEDVHLGMAVDTPEGLFVPVLRAVNTKQPRSLRQELTAIREHLQARSIPKEDLQGATLTLSNFGTIAGRYATPIVTPPQVAIVGAGRSRDAVVAHKGKIKIRRLLPLSLSFDHRCITGGEAARFLRALIEDLEDKV
ncbi:MAG: dihydrolipoamide acetyltransferase family protein [Gammaproteobacteria bacterium]